MKQPIWKVWLDTKARFIGASVTNNISLHTSVNIPNSHAHPILPWSFRVLGFEWCQAFLQDLTGVLHSSSIEVWGGGGSRGAGVGHRVGARLWDVDLGAGDTQNPAGNLAQIKVKMFANDTVWFLCICCLWVKSYKTDVTLLGILVTPHLLALFSGIEVFYFINTISKENTAKTV